MSRFTSDWHSYTIPVWEKVVLPAVPAGRRRFLELGSHEGRSAVWLIENGMKEGDELTCVDLWRSEQAERLFDENVSGRAEKVKADITSTIIQYATAGRNFDCIYVDGDHDGRIVLENAVIAWRLLPSGGVMVFDDYRYKIPNEQSFGRIDTQFGIDAFLQCYCLVAQVLHRSAQVVVKKLR